MTRKPCRRKKTAIGVARNLSWGHSAGFVQFFLGVVDLMGVGEGSWKGALRGQCPLPRIFLVFDLKW